MHELVTINTDESVQSDCDVVQQSVVIVSSFGIGGIFIHSNSPKVEAYIHKKTLSCICRDIPDVIGGSCG